VRSYLRLSSDSFKRTGRGRYQLVAEGDSQLALLSDRADDVFVQEPDLNGTGQQASLPPPSQWDEFQFGQTRLVNADCLEWLDAAPAHSIHAVVTDPPYGLVEYTPVQQRKLRSGRGGVWRIPPSFDGHTRSPLPRFTTLKPSEVEELRRFFARWGRSLWRVLTPGAHVMVASNPLLSYVVADALAGQGFERRGEIIRLVMTMRGGDRPKNAHEEFPGVSVMPRSMWEPWLLFRKPTEGRVQDNLRKWGTGGLRRISDTKPFGDVIQSHPTQKKEREIAPHPSLKPQAFLRQIVRAVLPLGKGVVLDPFAGSGSTLAAAEAIGYQSIGIEMDAGYYEVAKHAIPQLAALPVKRED
jgi:site-specific DNA-methyltransferase (adenine-specific)